MELMTTFRAALPFAEAERKWLLDDFHDDEQGAGIGEPRWSEVVRRSEISLISAGLSRVVHGRDFCNAGGRGDGRLANTLVKEALTKHAMR